MWIAKESYLTFKQKILQWFERVASFNRQEIFDVIFESERIKILLKNKTESNAIR